MENFGICLQSLIPIRSTPAESAEMVTQLLFGETYKVLEKEKKWIKIKIASDQYIGWFDDKLFEAIDEAFLDQPKQFSKQALTEIKKNNFPIFVPGGSEFPIDINTYSIGLNTIKHDIKNSSTPFNASLVVSFAKSYLNAPYLWGGKSIMGIDCSGLTQVCFKAFGIQLPRDASQQVKIGKTVGFINEAQAGDLAFFDNSEGNVTHVGIIISPQQIIHASGCVRIDKIDHQGIFNSETQGYTHKLRIIKRIETS